MAFDENTSNMFLRAVLTRGVQSTAVPVQTRVLTNATQTTSGVAGTGLTAGAQLPKATLLLDIDLGALGALGQLETAPADNLTNLVLQVPDTKQSYTLEQILVDAAPELRTLYGAPQLRAVAPEVAVRELLSVGLLALTRSLAKQAGLHVTSPATKIEANLRARLHEEEAEERAAHVEVAKKVGELKRDLEVLQHIYNALEEGAVKDEVTKRIRELGGIVGTHGAKPAAKSH